MTVSMIYRAWLLEVKFVIASSLLLEGFMLVCMPRDWPFRLLLAF